MSTSILPNIDESSDRTPIDACAAAAAAVRIGYCREEMPIKVELPGGNVTVTIHNGRVMLNGGCETVFEGTFAY